MCVNTHVVQWRQSLSTCFLNGGWYAGGIKFNQVNVRFYPSPSHRLLPASCKMRQRNFSPHNKRQQPKKINLDHPKNANIQVNGNEGSDPGIFSKDGNSDSIEDPEPISDDGIPITREAEHLNEEDTIDSGAEAKTSPIEITHSSANIAGKSEGGEQLSGIHLEDLIGMIRNAEKNIHLLNHARIRARDDLEKILCEKEDLQGEINSLETKLAETDARLRVAAQEKIHVELLEEQLEKLRNELSSRNSSEGLVYNVNDSFPFSQSNDVNSYSEGLDVWRTENNSLKDELQALKTELSNLKETDERVQILEKERLSLQSSLKELEFKLSVSQEDVSKISSLKSECKSLYEKVEHLQQLLENATKQADQAILALQQNQELRKKVDRLEESLEEANVYKLSSEKMQKYNELMQQKIQILDERLLRSDEEIDSYVQLYQNSMKEFQDTLNILKEESKKRARDETVDEMPLEFWSRLLLMIDGWFLEKKISAEDAMLLREMIWKRDVNIHDAYMSCKEKTERETIATFLRLTSSTSRPRLHVIHIAAEMAPVAKVGGLGDVVAGLSKALQKKGHLVEIVLPKYDCMHYELVQDLKVLENCSAYSGAGIL
ncbi:putative starch synthase 4 [Forsythia ovata]|uniref:starch synthase n=1 Tax=Forsythia ovata TaxID=205694 RepID=A0ABD1S1J6_9LAMI